MPLKRKKKTLWLVCDQCQEELCLAHGNTALELKGERLTNLIAITGWELVGKKATCADCAGNPPLNGKEMLADFANYNRRLGNAVEPDAPRWNKASLFGAAKNT